jgi:bifunctional DNA-binding transcriptional regulator/antitoxin component of YhaV-PrlF toxin-antitoxin module
MFVQVNVDRQGRIVIPLRERERPLGSEASGNLCTNRRIVIPLRERERLGVATGGTLELIATPEGVLLERNGKLNKEPYRLGSGSGFDYPSSVPEPHLGDYIAGGLRPDVLPAGLTGDSPAISRARSSGGPNYSDALRRCNSDSLPNRCSFAPTSMVAR